MDRLGKIGWYKDSLWSNFLLNYMYDFILSCQEIMENLV
ncbi:MAG: hypothetical protein BAJALOKI3v1_40058 [Promethearchaeota archaeon]|nr:MAG: hypothetical protein BAJALOKI3v1_40058 [Candidatus Lokiarchaeota archaeon]